MAVGLSPGRVCGFRYRDVSANHAPYSATNHKLPDDVTMQKIYIWINLSVSIHKIITFITRNQLMHVCVAQKLE